MVLTESEFEKRWLSFTEFVGSEDGDELREMFRLIQELRCEMNHLKMRVYVLEEHAKLHSDLMQHDFTQCSVCGEIGHRENTPDCSKYVEGVVQTTRFDGKKNLVKMDNDFRESVRVPVNKTNQQEHPFQPVLDLIEQYSKTDRPRSDPWTTILACYKELKEVEKQKLVNKLNLTPEQKKLLGILWKNYSRLFSRKCLSQLKS
jgi:hypothetical protein